MNSSLLGESITPLFSCHSCYVWRGQRDRDRGWGRRTKGIPGDEVLKSSPFLTVTGNQKYSHTNRAISSFAHQSGSGRRQRRREVIKREGGGRVCVESQQAWEGDEKKRRRREDGRKELHDVALIFSPCGGCLFLYHGLVQALCSVPRRNRRCTVQHSARELEMNQPQQRAFEMATCASAWREERIRLSQASGSLQSALAWEPVLPRRCVCEWGRKKDGSAVCVCVCV